MPVAEFDRTRILVNLDERKSYLEKLKGIVPQSFIEYQRSLLQIIVEATIDIWAFIVKGLRLEFPDEEGHLLEKLHHAGVISRSTRHQLREMKGLRNILVHEYARVDDRLRRDPLLLWGMALSSRQSETCVRWNIT